MLRRDFLTGVGLAHGVRASAQSRRQRPNLLFLIADDHAGYALGADGNRQAATPNLDRLASEGVRFARHYCNSPVCTPSRQSFFTGQLPHAAGVTVLSTALATDKPTLAKQLKAAGYSTAVFGKMHFNRPSHPGLHGFDFLMTEDDTLKAWAKEGTVAPISADIRAKPPWRPFQDPARIWLNADKLPYPRRIEEMRSSFVVREASRYLEEHKDKQFALWVSFTEPHSPFDFPIEYRDLYSPSGFTSPKVGPEDAWQIPLVFRDLTDADKRGIIAAYYTSVSFVDHSIGRVLDRLRELGLEEDTLVVYMPDHGYSLGQHGRFEKHCCYEPALRVPLLIRWPGKIRPRVVQTFTESVDLPATFLDLIGVDPLPVNHGQNLFTAKPRDSIFSEYLENEEACIRTARFKFIFCSGRRERKDGYKTDRPTYTEPYVRLFDLERDPGEFHDVAREHPDVVARLKRRMLERFRGTHPERGEEPANAGTDDILMWYLRPRDAKS